MFQINDIFETLQGEGFHTGRSALFIRLPFCNLSCPWCDTEFDSYQVYPESDIQGLLDRVSTRFAVVTGGEPSFNKQLAPLVGILKKRGFEVALESNGQFVAPDLIDFLTISPKRWNTKTGEPGTHPPFWWNTANRPSEIKLVWDKDMTPSVPQEIFRQWKGKEWVFRDPERPLFFLSPEWGAREEVLPKILAFIRSNPLWRLSQQTHKFLGIP